MLIEQNNINDLPVQIVECPSGSSISINANERLFLESNLGAICTNRNCDSSGVCSWKDVAPLPKPEIAAPKCPKTGDRALLISRFTDN